MANTAEADSAREEQVVKGRQSPVPSDLSDADDFQTPGDLQDSKHPSTALDPTREEEDRAQTPTRPSFGDDNATLAALAATSSAGPASPQDSDTELDQNVPSFILVASLRSQITDLTSQVTSLNSKLVSSYTRIGDFEDDLHDRADEVTRLKARVAALEKSKGDWEREIEVGGWVEKDHVQTEMRGLMHKVLEETKSKESAVEAHSKLETEIENLTSSLFTEANRMVAVERFARARAEEKMRSLEESAAVMTGMFEEVQTNLRETVDKLEEREKEITEVRLQLVDSGLAASGFANGDAEAPTAVFSDGAHVSTVKGLALLPHRPSPPHTPSRSFIHATPPRLLTSVLPYTEFVAFVTYLRQLRVQVLSRPHEYAGYPHHSSSSVATRGFGTTANASNPAPFVSIPPATLLGPHIPLSTHLSQPFIARCVNEDSDPTLRLDLAPGLGFLSRRNVGTAIVDGTLLIEPTYSGSTLPSSTCALCGVGLEQWWAGGEIVATGTAKARVDQTMRKVLGGGGWSIPNFTGAARSTPKEPVHRHSSSSTSSLPSSPAGGEPPFSFPTLPQQQIHIFRINDTSTSRYAICPVYCLPRLRAVCEFWTYIRAMERGLLLEEGFHFVGGKDVNGALTESRNGSGSNISLGGKSQSRSSLVGLKSVENLAASPSAFAPVQEKVEEVSTAVETDAEEQVVEEKVGAEEESEAPSAEEPEVDVEVDAAVEDDKAEAAADEDEVSPPGLIEIPTSKTVEEVKENDSPMLSAPSSPSIGGPKPPVPKRSGARPSPVIPSTPADDATPVPSSAPTPSPSPGPPKLPPRAPPAPASHAGGTRAVNGGTRASELGGTIDAMEIVGGATGWEDRCWAEVVRLKECVFWTRVAREPVAE